MKNLRDRKGFTLVEVIVTVFIVAIVLGMVASIIGFFSGFFGDENQYLDRQQSMRVLMLNIEKDIRTSDQSINFDEVACKVIGQGDAGTPINTYCFENGEVRRNGELVARNVEIFNLTETDGRVVNLNIRMESDSSRKQVEATLTIYLRKGSN